ncbi:MAG TPA: thioredoxin-disulfide reductase [Treponemataceae bacterium]|nr:thioredoxin-disulfide reductase [Treponemataceae bacterium]
MDNLYDMIIIGGGTAGLAAAQYAGRANLKTLVIEEKGEGGQAVLIDSLENYPGVLEPVNGYQFSADMKEQALRFGAEFMYGKVTGVSRTGENFRIPIESPEDAPVVFQSRTVLLATGAEHKKIGVPGEAEYYGKGVSYCATCDGPFFKNKHIVVIGGGDAACDEAGFLAHLTNKVTMIHRKDTFRAQKAIAERTLKNPHISVRFNTTVSEIRGTGGERDMVGSVLIKDEITGKEEVLDCDAVFIFVGMIPRTELASLAKQDKDGYLITDEYMHTSIRGLFAAGDLRAKPFRQIITAIADGAIAAHSASACIDEQRCGVSF